MDRVNILKNDDNVISTVIHISDLHFTIKDRYIEYQDVFDKFTHDIKKYDRKTTIVVMTGDIFNEKNKLESKLISFVKSTIYKISRVLPVFMITGNHDLLSSNRNIPDSITSVFFSDSDLPFMIDNEHDIYYLKSTGYYIYNNVGFGVLSIFDVLDNTSSGLRENVIFPDGNVLDEYFKNRENTVKLALLHTTVKDSLIQTNDGHSRFLESYENHISVDNIKNYDYILLGDVHKFQYIENACYPSSLVQQNFGEDVIDHGYVIHDFKNKKREFKRVVPKYGFIKCHVKVNRKKVSVVLPQYNEQTKIYYPTHVNVRLHLNDATVNNYVDAKHTKDDLLNACYQWFADNHFTIRNCEIVFENEKQMMPVLSNASFQNNAIDWTSFDMIEKYVNEATTCENVESVIKELRTTYEISLLQKNSKNTLNWSLKTLEWSNLFCYGENNMIDFTNESVNIILGNNYSGKSSIIDILLFTIYGNATRADKIVQVINNNKKTAFCSLVFTYGDEVLKIERYLKKKTLKSGDSHGQKVYLKRIRGETYENVIVNTNSWTGEKIVETPLKLDEYTSDVFGNRYNFMSTYLLNQNNSNSFVHMKNTERKELIESWLHLDCLEEIRKNLKNSKKSADDEYLKISASLKQLESISENIISQEIDIDKIKDKMVELQLQIDNFKSLNAPVKPVKPVFTFQNRNFSDDNDILLCKINLDGELQQTKQQIKNVYYDDNHYQIICENFKTIQKQVKENQAELDLQNTKTITIRNFKYDNQDDYLLEIQQLNANINQDVMDYFKDKQNFIPPNKQRANYLAWSHDYNEFINQHKQTIDRYFQNVNNTNEFIQSTKQTFEKEKLKQELREKYCRDLSLIKVDNHFENQEFENVDLQLQKSEQYAVELWNQISKLKTKIINPDKHDTTFCLHYYEYINDKIDKMIADLQTQELEFSDVHFLKSVEYYKERIETIKTIEKELTSLQPSVKNLSRFSFEKNCQCCVKNSELLKYSTIMDKYNQLKLKLTQLESEDTVDCKVLENNILLIQKYEQFKLYMTDTMMQIEQLRSEKENYETVKSLFVNYKTEQRRTEYLRVLKLIQQNQNNYDRQKECDFLQACKYLQRYHEFEHEKLEWNQYVNKYDEYESNLQLYEQQIKITQNLSLLHSELEQFIYHKKRITLTEQQKTLKKQINSLLTEKSLMENKKQQFENSERARNRVKSLEMDLHCFTELKHAYDHHCSIYKKQILTFEKDKSIYDNEKLQNDMREKQMMDFEVQVRTFENMQKQRKEIQSQIDIKKQQSYEIFNKINVLKMCIELMSLNGYNHWIYKNVIPLLNTYVNDILQNVVDFICDIRLENENGKTSINVYIKNENSEFYIPIKMTSGFQTQILNIAFRLCLIRLNNSTGNVMFMDESFVSFDVNYQSKIPELLSYFTKYIKHVFIISHHNDLEKFIKGKYHVEKNGLYSKIKLVK